MRMAYEILIGVLLFIYEFLKSSMNILKGFLVTPFKTKDNVFLEEMSKLNLFLMIPISALSFWYFAQYHSAFGILASIVIPAFVAGYADTYTKNDLDGDHLFGYIVISNFVIAMASFLVYMHIVPKYTAIGKVELDNVNTKTLKLENRGSIIKVHLSKNDKEGSEVTIYEETEDCFWFKTNSSYYTYKPREVQKIKKLNEGS